MFDKASYHKAYYKTNREHLLAQNKAKRESLPEEVKQWRKETYGTRQKERYKRLRLECLAKYGGKCTCCGEDRPEFLSFDHIDGGGTKHRQIDGGRIILWLMKHNYPAGFQVLCHNCNMAKGFYGECPHKSGVQQYVQEM